MNPETALLISITDPALAARSPDIEYILRNTSSIDFKLPKIDKPSIIPFKVACKRGYILTFYYYLATMKIDYDQAYYIACGNGQKDLLNHMLSSFIPENPSLFLTEGVIIAIRREQLDVLKFLTVYHRLNPLYEAFDAHYGCDLLFQTAIVGGNKDIISFLLREFCYEVKYKHLIPVCYEGDLQLLQILLHYWKINSKNPMNIIVSRNDLFVIACKLGRTDIIDFLAENHLLYLYDFRAIKALIIQNQDDELLNHILNMIAIDQNVQKAEINSNVNLSFERNERLVRTINVNILLTDYDGKQRIITFSERK